MVKQIMKDIVFLKRKSTPASKADAEVIRDLKDTLEAHRDGCVGMAANMIGVSKRIIIVDTGMGYVVMLNPVITKRDGRYETEEGCLSLVGKRKAVRYQNITVRYMGEDLKQHQADYSGFFAQIIQHECDHLNGVII
ncbi:MAG: peptide deformylase [Ruminococcus sp.]|nr:peptide deformylase [Ruminococcus sp.]